MKVLQGFEELVHDEPLMNIFQNIGSDDCMQISLHVLEDQVDISVILCF